MADVKVFTIDEAYEDVVKAKKLFGQTRSSSSVLRDVASSIGKIKKPTVPKEPKAPKESGGETTEMSLRDGGFEKSKGPWKRGKKNRV